MKLNLFLAILICGIVGCGGNSVTVNTLPTDTLTVADWKELPTSQKYEPETFERLKRGDPKLETPEGWEAFNRTTLLSARKKDFPNGSIKR